MTIEKSLLTKNPCYKIGKKITVKGLMLHSVGCPQPSANVFIKNWNKTTYTRACVHGFIDANTGVVYQTLPWNYRGWHGGGSSNNTHIGIEMCEPACIKYTKGSSFTCSNLTEAKACVKRTYESAVALFAMLCEQYNLDPLTDGVIVSHKEGYTRGISSNHSDPEHLWNGLNMGYTMDGFRKDIKNAMNKTTETSKVTTTTTAATVSYIGRTTTALNFRSTASSKNDKNIILTLSKNHYVSVIKEQSNGWVYCQTVVNGKSYKGWVFKKYLTKYSASKFKKRTVTTASGLNIRTGKGTKYTKITTMPNKSIFYVVSFSLSWGLIWYNNMFGYANLSKSYSK